MRAGDGEYSSPTKFEQMDPTSQYLQDISEGQSHSLGLFSLNWPQARRKLSGQASLDPQLPFRCLHQFLTSSAFHIEDSSQRIALDHSDRHLDFCWTPGDRITEQAWNEVPLRLANLQLPKTDDSTYFLERALHLWAGRDDLSITITYPQRSGLSITPAQLARTNPATGTVAHLRLERLRAVPKQDNSRPSQKALFAPPAAATWPEYFQFEKEIRFSPVPTVHRPQQNRFRPGLLERILFAWLVLSPQAEENQLGIDTHQLGAFGYQVVDPVGQVLPNESRQVPGFSRYHSAYVLCYELLSEQRLRYPNGIQLYRSGQIVHRQAFPQSPGICIHHAGQWSLDADCSLAIENDQLSQSIQLLKELVPKFFQAVETRLDSLSFWNQLTSPLAYRGLREWPHYYLWRGMKPI